jgi:hypothetical protein
MDTSETRFPGYGRLPLLWAVSTLLASDREPFGQDDPEPREKMWHMQGCKDQGEALEIFKKEVTAMATNRDILAVNLETWFPTESRKSHPIKISMPY